MLNSNHVLNIMEIYTYWLVFLKIFHKTLVKDNDEIQHPHYYQIPSILGRRKTARLFAVGVGGRCARAGSIVPKSVQLHVRRIMSNKKNRYSANKIANLNGHKIVLEPCQICGLAIFGQAMSHALEKCKKQKFSLSTIFIHHQPIGDKKEKIEQWWTKKVTPKVVARPINGYGKSQMVH